MLFFYIHYYIMLVLMFLILARCAVKSDDTSNSYYVVEMPEDVSQRAVSRPFRVYWNVPTMQCKSKRIPFENLYEKYGIIQNEGDSFRGEKITILYDPGLFPALFKNESTGKFRYRNGGVPQEGDLSKHLAAFRVDLEKSIPDIDFNGIGIIDFESWRPIFRQNFGVLVPYKEISYENERKIHWWWPKGWIQEEARKNFEESAREFMMNTIIVAKEMRPRAVWGYYGFPYCFNMASNNMAEDCSKEVQLENDKSSWLWAASSALFPSVYSSRGLTPAQLQALVRGRVREAARAKAGARNVLPYFWFRYRDGDYFDQVDLDTALDTMYHSKASGFIIWGSSNDVNTVEKCNNLLEYVHTTLGPTIAKYTKYQNRLGAIEEISEVNENTTTTDAIDDIETTNNDNDQKLELKPELNLLLPENNTKEISNINSESLDLALSNSTYSNESKLIDLVVNLHKNDEDGSNVRENNVVEVNYTDSPTVKTESTVTETAQTEFVTYESVAPSNRSTINNVETISSNIDLDVTTEYIDNATNIDPNEYEYIDFKNKQNHKNYNDDDFLTTIDEFLTVKPSIANGNNGSIEFEVTTEIAVTTETEVEIEDLNRIVFDGSSKTLNDSTAAPSASMATNHIGDQVVIYV